jgi:hypothetical protein
MILNADVMCKHVGFADRSEFTVAGSTFTDATCDYNNDPTVTHDANASIVAGLTVQGTGIPAGAIVGTITDSTHFELATAASDADGQAPLSTTGGGVTNGTLTFYPQHGHTSWNHDTVAWGENTASAAVFVSSALAPYESHRIGGQGGAGANEDNVIPPQRPFTGSAGTAYGTDMGLRGVSGVYAEQYNYAGLVHSMIRAMSAVDKKSSTADENRPFQARSAEIVASSHYFLRLNNKEFNYSNNPSFATGSNGQLVNQDFENDPKVYVTTVGLYNDSNELLAVAKLSRPLEKSFSKEALLRVRLDF